MRPEEAKHEIFASALPQRNYQRGRTEARVRYYKPAASRTSRAMPEKTSRTNFKARLVFQATICGGFLALLLFFNIIDTNFTNAVTGWIDRNISYDMLAEEGGVGGRINNLLGIFVNDESAYYEAYMTAGETETAMPEAQTPGTEASGIDESILREINDRVDVYYENNR